ncbi:MAG: hypothetical protein IIA92_13800 [Chloroflexi bacterium]|nr:hypothetical protein [Chloroflexota bacterium]
MVQQGDDPEKQYGPTSSWQDLHLGGPDQDQGAAPRSSDFSPTEHPAPPQTVKVDQDLVNALDRRYNVALADFATGLKRDLLELMDQKLVATLNTQAALASTTDPAPAPANGAPAAPPISFEALATAAMPIINMIAAKFIGAPAADSTAGLLTAKFKEVADVVTMVNTTFMGNHDESVRMGMRMASDAYTFAYKATGKVPDAAAFNASLGPGSQPAGGVPAGGLSRGTFDFGAEATRIAAELASK